MRKILIGGFVQGFNDVSLKLYNHIQLIAPTNMSVLIKGESGTGKEFVAREIHSQSKRSSEPFIAVDCGSLSRELGVSELFGHTKGAFTSAIRDKRGVFEEANGGTVFMDEIGNLPQGVQIQLLRALQERKIRPVGSSREIEIDVRILSATNEDLSRAIEEGRFREDIYHRINEFSLEVPPIRERGEDIMVFANEFLKQANQELEKRVMGFSEDVQLVFMSYLWPGNLRQMKNVIKRAVLFAKSDMIKIVDLPDQMITPQTMVEPGLRLKRIDERAIIIQALARCLNNKSSAAKLLGIDRKTLYNKLKRYKIAL